MHPIDPFLEAWGLRTKRNGFDTRRRVYRALELGGTWSRGRLELTLRAVLVSNPEERREFDDLFPEFFSADGELVASAGVGWSPSEALTELRDAARRVPASDDVGGGRLSIGTDVHALVPSAVSVTRDSQELARGPRTSNVRRWWLVGLLAVSVATLVGAGVAIVRDRSHLPPKTPAVEVDGAPGKIAPAPEEKRPSKGSWSTGLLALAALVQGSALLAWRQAQRRARPKLPALPPGRDIDPFRSRDLNLRSDRIEVFDRRNVRRFAYLLGSEVARSKTKLDLQRTVDRTLRKGTFLPVFALTRRPNRVAVMLGTRLDPVSEAVVDAVIASMRREGIAVEVLTLHQRPLDPFDVGLFIANLRELGPHAVLRALGQKRIAVIEARDPASWGAEVRDCPYPVFALDEPGLAAAIRSARRRRTEIQSAAMPTYRPTHGVAGLREALPLAAACALVEPCDLGAINELRHIVTPWLSFLTIQRIMALPGVTPDVTAVQFTPSMREALAGRIGTKVQRRVLAWHIDRLERARVVPTSRAAAVRDRELALARLRFELLASERLDPAKLEGSIVELERQARTPVLSTRLSERASDFRAWFEGLPPTVRRVLDHAHDVRCRLSRIALLPEFVAPPPSRAASAFLIAGTFSAVTLFGGSVPADVNLNDAASELVAASSSDVAAVADAAVATSSGVSTVGTVDVPMPAPTDRVDASSEERVDAAVRPPPSTIARVPADAGRTPPASITLKGQVYDRDTSISAKTVIIAAGARIRVNKGATLTIRAEQLIIQGKATFDGRGESVRGRPGGNGARIEIAYAKVQGDRGALEFLVDGGNGSVAGNGGSYALKTMADGESP